MEIIIKILFIIGSYLCGSIMFGPIIYQLIKKEKIKDDLLPGGSGSMKRMGILKGVLVGLLDITKVFLPVYLAILLNYDFLTISLCSISGILGHNWPIFYKFKGGLGLSSIIGGLVLLIPKEIGLGILTSLITGFIFTKLGWTKKLKMEPSPIGAIFGLIVLIILSIYWSEPVQYIYLEIALIAVTLSKSGYCFIKEHTKSQIS